MMINWKETFILTRSLYRMDRRLIPGEYWFYTCRKESDGIKLCFSRHLENQEIIRVRQMARDWFWKFSNVTETDMKTFTLIPIPYMGGLLIIKISLKDLSLKERKKRLDQLWNIDGSKLDELDNFEILYFQSYPADDSKPFHWDLTSFEQHKPILSYHWSIGEKIWIKIPVNGDLFTKLKTEALKEKPKYVEDNDRIYYFDYSNGSLVCYFYPDQNPKPKKRIRRCSLTKTYQPPNNSGKKYVWLSHLPNCSN